MEYMKIDSWLGGILSRFLNKAVAKSVGFKPNISLQDVSFASEGEVVKAKVCVEMSKADFEKLMTEVTK